MGIQALCFTANEQRQFTDGHHFLFTAQCSMDHLDFPQTQGSNQYKLRQSKGWAQKKVKQKRYRKKNNFDASRVMRQNTAIGSSLASQV